MADQQHNDEDSRYLTLAEIMPPEKANFSGNIHGGYLLEYLDRVAYTCAARYSRQYVVTLAVNQVLFKQPIHVGELVTCLAAVNYVGTSSMEIGIKVLAENLQTGICRHTNSCFFTMVCLDEQHRPAAAPALVLRTEDENRRWQEAKLRRQLAKEYQQKHVLNKQQPKDL